jgi:crotonobetainyl-CoA:carnitine CoA-transferase CaiB-like acyl-CoA transferase
MPTHLHCAQAQVSPLAGIRVLDLSRLLPGPYCTLLLADLGAEVIKIETPLVGDYARTVTGFGGPAMFEAINRNKKSVAINYRHSRGKEILLQLARTADVMIETFRPGAVKRWGIDYEAVSLVNPRIVYCSLSGYGQDGPYVHRAGHDLNYLALGGLLAVNGTPGGPPIPPGVQIADLSGGMLAAIAILAALVGRSGTGQGTFLDVAMLDAVASWAAPMAGVIQATSANGQSPRGRMPLSGGLPCYNVYETADGRFISLGALEPHFWTAFCNAIRRSDLLPRQFDATAIGELTQLFGQHTRDEWLELLREADACIEPVKELDEALRDPHLLQRGLVTGHNTYGSPFRFAARPDSSAAPALGQHTCEILEQLGLDEREIRELEKAGIIKG